MATRKDYTQEIIEMKESLNKAKVKRERLAGERDSLIRRGEEKFGIKTIAQAQREIKAIKKKREVAEDKLIDLLKEFDEAYGQFDDISERDEED